MLNNTIKNLLSIILIYCLLLQGCKTQQTPTPPKTIIQKHNFPEQPEPKKIDFSHLKDLSKEELEQEIQECEEYFIQLYDYDQDKKMVAKYEIDRGRLPAFIFLDKQGKEFLRQTGEPSKKELLETIMANKEK